MYLTRGKSIAAIAKMSQFSDDLFEVYRNHGISLDSDVGRRNIVLSAAQEKYFAEVIKGAVSDGRTGEADIIITNKDGVRELECKLTSQGTRGEWRLQMDEKTLETKGKLDMLYMLSDRQFKNIAVFLFHDLTSDDFHPAASSSRGKSRMKKYSAFQKCTPLIGDFCFKKRGSLTPGISITLEDMNDVIRSRKHRICNA